MLLSYLLGTEFYSLIAPNSFYTERYLFRKVSIPNGHFSDTQAYGSSLHQTVVNPDGHYHSESNKFIPNVFFFFLSNSHYSFIPFEILKHALSEGITTIRNNDI